MVLPTIATPAAATHFLASRRLAGELSPQVYSANTAGEMASPLSAEIRDAFVLPGPSSMSFSDTNAATFSVAGLLELTGSTDPDVLRALALRGFEEFFGEVTTSIGPRATLAWASALALRASGSSQAPLVLWSLGVLPGRAQSNYRLSGPKLLVWSGMSEAPAMVTTSGKLLGRLLKGQVRSVVMDFASMAPLAALSTVFFHGTRAYWVLWLQVLSPRRRVASLRDLDASNACLGFSLSSFCRGF